MAGEADDRVSIPLHMLEGNLEVLLREPLFVQSIQLKHDPIRNDGVILLVNFTDEQREAAKRIGFRTGKVG